MKHQHDRNRDTANGNTECIDREQGQAVEQKPGDISEKIPNTVNVSRSAFSRPLPENTTAKNEKLSHYKNCTTFRLYRHHSVF
jgi:hypothetical protein